VFRGHPQNVISTPGALIIMPNYRSLIFEAKESITEITELQELLKVIEENCDNPKRVKLMVQIYYSNMECQLDILSHIAMKMESINLQGSRKGKKEAKHNRIGTITFGID
jgi:hypothetical protein